MRNVILPLILVTLILISPQLIAKQMEYVVTVVDTMGRPIQGAEVSAWEQDFDWGGSNDVVTLQLINPVTTDAAGNAHIKIDSNKPDHSVIIFVQKAGFSIGWDSASQRARITEIRIVLDRINATAGIVTDEENRPITGAEVVAHPVDEIMVDGSLTHLEWPHSLFKTATDHEGRFSFDCLAEWMEVSFEVQYPGRAYTDTTYTIEAEYLPLYKAGQKDIHITMYPAGQIKGRILAARGEKIEGIQLIARGEQIRNGKRFLSVSDSEGYFTFENLPPDTYLVTTDTIRSASEQQLTAGAIAKVDIGQTAENVRIRMRDPIQLEVAVKNMKTDQPVANATVRVAQKRGSQIISHLDYQTTTNSQGIARVIALPGKCDLSVSCQDYDASFGEYLVRSTDTHVLMGIMPYSSVAGQVVYENGRPAVGVEVETSLHETEREVTDRNGRFRLRFSESMAQRGFVIARDIENNMAGVVDITELEGSVKVVLKKAAILKGSVMDPDGMPIPRARIDLSNHVPHYLSCFCNPLYSDEEGRFTLSAVPYTQPNYGYSVSASVYGYSVIKFDGFEVRQDMGDIIELPPLILKKQNMTLSGIAVYAEGAPAAYKQVHLTDVENMDGQPVLHSVTDNQGRFSFERACEGWLRIQCGSAMLNDFGNLFAKGGDKVTVIMNNNYESLQLKAEKDSFVGEMLPEYDTAVKGIEPVQLSGKRLLLCYWWIADEESKKVILQLARNAEQLEAADVFVVLVNVRPYSERYATVNIGLDKQWLRSNRIPFAEADIPDLEDIMEFRRATGASFIPHMILTDENKTITNEGFDIQWLRENVL